MIISNFFTEIKTPAQLPKEGSAAFHLKKIYEYIVDNPNEDFKIYKSCMKITSRLTNENGFIYGIQKKKKIVI